VLGGSSQASQGSVKRTASGVRRRVRRAVMGPPYHHFAPLS
jgi:hypothetical protein